ncbi:MAG: MBL fold metallo-hydrolase [Pseudomonadota bacterium]
MDIAQSWFDHRVLEKGFWQIFETHCSRYLTGNSWLIEGESECVLIDTGSGLDSLRSYIERFTDKPITAVALNCFYDHAGGLHEFDVRCAHEDDKPGIENPNPHSSAAAHYVSPAMMEKLPRADFSLENYCLKATTLTRVLQHNDLIELDDRRFRVIHTPGVTPGSICLYEENTGSLFTSDSYFKGPGNVEALPRDAEGYELSMERLSALQVNRVFPGHFDPMESFPLNS